LIIGTGASTGSRPTEDCSSRASLARVELEYNEASNYSFCKAGTFYLVFKEHRTRIEMP